MPNHVFVKRNPDQTWCPEDKCAEGGGACMMPASEHPSGEVAPRDDAPQVSVSVEMTRAGGNVSAPVAGEEVPPDVAAMAAEMMGQLKVLPVSDVLELAARHYRRVLDPDLPEHDPRLGGAGTEYLAERCQALADLFRDSDAPTRCVLDGMAGAVDLVRGYRVLALRHPVPEAREMYAALGNCLCLCLSSRVSGVAVDVEPALVSPDSCRATATIWHQQVVRASQSVREMQNAARRSGGFATSQGGLALIGKSAQVRARIVQDFQMQGMAELGVLLGVIGLDVGEETPDSLRPDGPSGPRA